MAITCRRIRVDRQQPRSLQDAARRGDYNSPLVHAAPHLHGTPCPAAPASPLTSQGCKNTHPFLVQLPANLHGFSPAPGITLGSATGAARAEEDGGAV